MCFYSSKCGTAFQLLQCMHFYPWISLENYYTEDQGEKKKVLYVGMVVWSLFIHTPTNLHMASSLYFLSQVAIFRVYTDVGIAFAVSRFRYQLGDRELCSCLLLLSLRMTHVFSWFWFCFSSKHFLWGLWITSSVTHFDVACCDCDVKSCDMTSGYHVVTSCDVTEWRHTVLWMDYTFCTSTIYI